MHNFVFLIYAYLKKYMYQKIYISQRQNSTVSDALEEKQKPFKSIQVKYTPKHEQGVRWVSSYSSNSKTFWRKHS